MSLEVMDAGTSDDVLLWTFLRHLRASRLLSDEDVSVLTQQVRPDQYKAVQAMLLDEGLLTPYQLNRIRQGDTDGLVLGQYRILEEVGRGGFGRVYKARHALMNRTVALKVVCPGRAKESHIRDLFLREAAVAERLNHPNIVLTYDADETDAALFLVMEYVPGPSLERYVSDRGPLSYQMARKVLHQTALALEFANKNGVIHRDIKPANILLPGAAAPKGSPDGAFVKVVDFGLAKVRARGPDPNNTIMCSEGAVVGTPAFMAPEQFADVHGADVRSDLYGLGGTAYFALTGTLPFAGTTTQQFYAMSRDAEPMPLQHIRPGIPADLLAVVRRLMAKNPADRFQTPAELIDALLAADEERPWNEAIAPGTAALAASPVEPTSSGASGGFPLPDRRSCGDAEPPPPAAVPIPPAAGQPSADEIGSWWREWFGVIDNLKRGVAPGLDEDEYRLLHRALTAAARDAGADPEGRTAAVAGRVVSAVEPWATLRSLAALDPRTRAELWEVCHRLDRAVSPRQAPEVPARWLVAAVLGLLAVAFLSPDASATVAAVADWARAYPYPAAAIAAGLGCVAVAALRPGRPAG